MSGSFLTGVAEHTVHIFNNTKTLGHTILFAGALFRSVRLLLSLDQMKIYLAIILLHFSKDTLIEKARPFPFSH